MTRHDKYLKLRCTFVNIVCLHWSVCLGVTMRSLETYAHVIPMPRITFIFRKPNVTYTFIFIQYFILFLMFIFHRYSYSLLFHDYFFIFYYMIFYSAFCILFSTLFFPFLLFSDHFIPS